MPLDPSAITGLAAVLGSMAGATASIATTWMTQRNQRIRERAQTELRRRETIYGEFITEVSRLTADAFEHSLEHTETLVSVYALLSRIHLIASRPVIDAAEHCCGYIVDLYGKPNMTLEQIRSALRKPEHPLRQFADACRAEMDRYAV